MIDSIHDLHEQIEKEHVSMIELRKELTNSIYAVSKRVDSIATRVTELEKNLANFEGQSDILCEQSDKELAAGLRKIRKNKRRIDVHDRLIVELLDRLRTLEGEK